MFLSFGNAFFWYRLVFLTELLLAEGLFTFRLRRRENFFWRLVGSILALYLIVFFLPILRTEQASLAVALNSVTFLLIFVLSVVFLYITFREPFINILFCALASYTTQHLAYEIYSLVVTVTGISEGVSGAYGYGEIPMEYNGFTAIAYADSYAIVYFLMYVVFGRKIRKNSDLHVKNSVVVALATVTLFTVIVFNLIVVQRIDENTDMLIVCLTYVYDIMCCLFVTSIQFGLSVSSRMKNELEIIRQLRTKEHEQYIIAKENMDLINLKCHDLKYQIRRLSTQGRLDEQVTQEIEQSIEIYDSVFKTGNEVLDVVLTEKGLLCNKNGIKLTCMADGKSLDFVSSSDLYSLFGNAVDNAIEAVREIQDKNKRTIGVIVRSVNGFVSISVHNYYSNKIQMVDGLPVTTKEDKRYHGFGLKSIRMIVEKYDGDLSVVTEEGVFYLNILFTSLSVAEGGAENAKG